MRTCPPCARGPAGICSAHFEVCPRGELLALSLYQMSCAVQVSVEDVEALMEDSADAQAYQVMLPAFRMQYRSRRKYRDHSNTEFSVQIYKNVWMSSGKPDALCGDVGAVIDCLSWAQDRMNEALGQSLSPEASEEAEAELKVMEADYERLEAAEQLPSVPQVKIHLSLYWRVILDLIVLLISGCCSSLIHR